VTAGWELFARGPTEVVRIQPALGRITRTPIPTLQSSGAVAFIAGPDRVLIRPWDYVPGYVVPDGSPVRELAGSLGKGGSILRGPDPSHLWVQSAEDGSTMSLVGLDGARTGPSIRLPVTRQWPAMSDGAGYVLVRGVGGDYDARPDGLHRVTTGAVVAVGWTRWLAVECDDRARCVSVVVDRKDGSRRRLGSAQADVTVPTGGVIAPDGSVAAVYGTAPTEGSNSLTVHLINLLSGADHPLALSLSPDGFDGSVVWSPDSRWLFVVSDRRLAVVDVRTRDVRDLGVALPPIEQLAVRAATP
jgi:hypothetical protein